MMILIGLLMNSTLTVVAGGPCSLAKEKICGAPHLNLLLQSPPQHQSRKPNREKITRPSIHHLNTRVQHKQLRSFFVCSFSSPFSFFASVSTSVVYVNITQPSEILWLQRTESYRRLEEKHPLISLLLFTVHSSYTP